MDNSSSPFRQAVSMAGKHMLRLPDGRWMEFVACGATSNSKATILYLYGSPTVDYDFDETEQNYYDQYIRVLAPKRPGYGKSTPYGESSLGWSLKYPDFHPSQAYMYDLACFVCKLGLKDFGIIGFSGGGIYALNAACDLQNMIQRYISVYEPLTTNGPRLTAVGVLSGTYHGNWYVPGSPKPKERKSSWSKEELTPCGFTQSTPGPCEGSEEVNHGSFDIDYLLSLERYGLEFDAVLRQLMGPVRDGEYEGYRAEYYANFGYNVEAWNYIFANAGRFVAANGQGVQIWNGSKDEMTPWRSGERLQREIGGHSVFTKIPFQEHVFDSESERRFLRKMLASMKLLKKERKNRQSGSDEEA